MMTDDAIHPRGNRRVKDRPTPMTYSDRHSLACSLSSVSCDWPIGRSSCTRKTFSKILR